MESHHQRGGGGSLWKFDIQSGGKKHNLIWYLVKYAILSVSAERIGLGNINHTKILNHLILHSKLSIEQ